MATYTQIDDSKTIFEEADGSPSQPATKVKFPNDSLTDNGDGTFTYTPSASGLDHGGLDGLSDDDHTQYHNNTRASTWLGTESIATIGTKDHDLLDGLSDDDHSIYTLLAGRSGGQTLIGGTDSGDNLVIQSTNHATKGNITFDGVLSINITNNCAELTKQGTATGPSTVYDSQALYFQGSVWDQSGAGQAEDRQISMMLEAGSGPDGSEPYKLIIRDNADNRCFTFNFTEGEHGIVIGDDWTGTWSGIPLLTYKDHNGGLITRVHNTSAGASAYAGMQLQNDLNRSFEFGLAGGSRGDAWNDVGWIWPGSNVNKLVMGVNAAERMALTSTGLRIQPNIAIAEEAAVVLDVRASGPATPQAPTAEIVAQIVGASGADTAIAIVAASNKESRIYFADTDVMNAATLVYDHNSGQFELSTEGSPRMSLSAASLLMSVDVDLNGNDILNAASITLNNAGLQIKDTNASHVLTIQPGSDLTADRTLSLVTGDAARTMTFTGDPTLDDWFDQSVKQAASPTYAGLNVGEYIYHTGDADTYLRFQPDDLRCYVGNVLAWQFTENDVQDTMYISTSGDVDVKIGLGGNGVFVEGSSGKVGIGHSNPPEGGMLDVRVSGAVAPPAILGATVGLFVGSANAQVSIIGGATNNCRLYFGDTASETVGGFNYAHTTDTLGFIAGGISRMTVNSTSLLMNVDIDLDGNSLLLGTNPGAVTLADMTVTAAAGAGVEQSIGLDVDAVNLFKAYAESDGAGGIQNTAIQAKARFHHMENGKVEIQTYNQDLADDAFFDLPAGVDGFIMASFDDGAHVAWAHFDSAGVVNGIYQSGDVDWSDADGKFCIFDNGTNVRVRNRYGATYSVKVWTWYGI